MNLGSVLVSWGKAMRDAVMNKERVKIAVRLPKILVLQLSAGAAAPRAAVPVAVDPVVSAEMRALIK